MNDDYWLLIMYGCFVGAFLLAMRFYRGRS